MYIVFYDDTCGLCDVSVQKLLKWDKKKVLLFAPLQGKTAKEKFGSDWPKLLEEDSIIFLENEVRLLRAKAVFRALWHIGGIFRILGIFSYLPTFPFDLIYRFIAKKRKYLGCPLTKKSLVDHKDRFLL